MQKLVSEVSQEEGNHANNAKPGQTRRPADRRQGCAGARSGDSTRRRVVDSTMTVRATWNEVVLAESNRTILVEGNQYFPLDDVMTEFLETSDSSTHCPWKGDASYYDVVVGERRNQGAAWYYAEPFHAASDIKGYVAFWKGVEVSGANADTKEIRPPGR